LLHGTPERSPDLVLQALKRERGSFSRGLREFGHSEQGPIWTLPDPVKTLVDPDGHVVWRPSTVRCSDCGDQALPPQLVDNRAQIADPAGLGVDKSGNVYILDANNYRVRKVDSGGVIHTVAGNDTNDNKCSGGPALAVGFDNPVGLTVDDTGAAYVADSSCGMVLKIAPGTGNTLSIAAGSSCLGSTGQACLPGDGGAAIQTQFATGPDAVVVDRAGNMYIAQANANLVRKVDSHGTITTFAGQVDPTTSPIMGVAGYSGDEGPATSAQLNGPVGLAVDGAGNVYIADSLNNVIRRVDSSGTIHTFAGSSNSSALGDGGPATAAQLSIPEGLAVDGQGNVYIADFGDSLVRYVDPSGVIHTLAGPYIGDPGNGVQLGPNAVAADNAGHVYIADATNSRVWITTQSPNTTSSSGSGIGMSSHVIQTPVQVVPYAGPGQYTRDQGIVLRYQVC